MNTEEDEEFLESVCALMRSALPNIQVLWREMGFSPQSLSERQSSTLNGLRRELDNMLLEEEGNVRDLTQRIAKNGRHVSKLCKELGLPVPNPPGVGLIDLDQELRQDLERLQEKKAERMQEVLDLKAEDDQLCDALDLEPYLISITSIPAPQDMDNFWKHVQELRQLKSQRLGVFLERKCTIISLMSSLELEPTSIFERDVVCEDDSTFVLSELNLRAADELLARLEQKVDDNMKRAHDMRRKIYSLIDKLKQDPAEKRDIENKFGGHSPNDLRELQTILDQLEVLKQEKMEEFIHATREELSGYWDLCYYSQEQRNKFSPLFSTDYSEELLRQHEDEVEKVRGYYDENRTLFAKVAKRQGLWKKMLELEAVQKDPNRLIKARGRELLEEEKDRRRVNKLLPKIETELREEMEEFHERHGQPFLVGGMPYEEFIEAEIEKHMREQEQERLFKQEAKKKQNFHETVYGSKPVTPAAKQNLKRKGAADMMAPNESKRLRPDMTARSAGFASSASSGASTMLAPKSPYVARKTPARSTTKLAGGVRSAATRSAATTRTADNAKRYGTREPSSRRRILADRNEEDSIISGNQNVLGPMDTLASIDSDNFLRDRPMVNSTFQKLPESPAPKRSALKTPQKSTLTCTPLRSAKSTSNLVTPKRGVIGTPAGVRQGSVFKTPSGRAPTPASRTPGGSSKKLTLRSGRALPFLI